MFLLRKLTQRYEVNLKRHSNNFDFLRVLAALLVLISHCPELFNYSVFNSDPLNQSIGMGMGRTAVLIFFIISGYLITRSWESKKSISKFFISRFLRIYPALIVITILSVFVLGPLLTTLNTSEYFNHHTTYKYLENVSAYRMTYYLPGVFEDNPLKGSINGSLWTIAYEFTCYLVIALVGVLSILKRKYGIVIILLGLILVDIFFKEQWNSIVIPVLGIDFKTLTPGLLFFLAGAAYYKYRSEVPFNLLGVLLSFAILYLLRDTTFYFSISILVFPYLVLSIVFMPIPFLNKVGKYGDFSYGIYLYAFPIQQILALFFYPKISGPILILLTLLCLAIFSFLSWNLVEKPAINLGKRIGGKQN